MGPSSCFVSWIKGFWGNSTSLQTLELCLLCNATENEWVPVPGVMGDGQAIAQAVPGEVVARQGGKKKSTTIYLISQVKVFMAFLF